MKRDDSLWKGIIEDLCPEFLRFFFPDADTLFDLDAKMEFLDKELQDLFPSDENDTGQRVVDKLVKVRTREGKDQWVLIHVEVQGYHDPHFPFRMLQYHYRILDRYKRPVAAIAIFTHKRKTVPDHYRVTYCGTTIEYTYNVYNIYNQSDKDLKSSPNIFALIVLAAKTALLSRTMTDDDLMTQHTWIFEALQARKLPRRNVMGVWAFLVNCVHFADPEKYVIFGKNLETITGKQNPMGVVEILKEQGRKEGLAQGLEQGKDLFVSYLLQQQHLSDEQIVDVAGVTLEFVQKVKRTLRKK